MSPDRETPGRDLLSVLVSIERDLHVMKWMLGANILLTLGVLWLVLFIHSVLL